ncbi:MAG: hypothetical protein OXL68_03440 [Paracoccaceae bacterium]|nr:hypothetical protein [Paracoccaceae bacterium]
MPSRPESLSRTLCRVAEDRPGTGRGPRLQAQARTGRSVCGALAAILLLAAVLPTSPARPGGLSGLATEWTQLLNNAELAHLASIEASQLEIAGEALATDIEQLRTLILAYRNMVANTERLPGNFQRQALTPVIELRRLYMQTGILAQSGKDLDGFLRSGQVEDPLFDQETYSRTGFRDRYDALQERWSAALESSLRKAGLTLADVESEAVLLDRLSERAGSAEGNLAALQVANELAGSLSRQVMDLRLLQSAQAEQTAVAWSRSLQIMDTKEALQRRYEDQLAIDRRRFGPGQGIHQLLGIE